MKITNQNEYELALARMLEIENEIESLFDSGKIPESLYEEYGVLDNLQMNYAGSAWGQK